MARKATSLFLIIVLAMEDAVEGSSSIIQATGRT